MPRRERARLLLRSLAKLLAVVLVAGAVGALLGIGLSTLTGDDEPPTAATSTTAATPPPQTTSNPAAGIAQVRVRVLGAVLRAASSPSGIRRQRARVAVRVRAENTGTTAVTLARPTLSAAGASVKTDPNADAPTTNFGPLAAGETQTVTLRFETAGALTAALTAERRGQLRIAGRPRTLFVTVGAPLQGSPQ